MTKTIIIIIFIFSPFICKTNGQTQDYFGQTYPDGIPVIFAPEVISVKGRLEHGLSFTPDMQEVAFGVLDQKDFRGSIWYTSKTKDHWTKPELFKPLQNESVFLPYFSPDGNSLVYTKSKTLENNYITDIWKLEKHGGIWGNAKKLPEPVNSTSREASACMTLNNTMYFSSNREEASLADIYYALSDGKENPKVQHLEAVSTLKDEESIFIAPNEEYMIFSRFETIEKGPDLIISYKNIKKEWTPAVALDSTINTSTWERRPFVTFDNRFLFFTRLTIDGSNITESDIYWVNTKKVFKPYVFNPIVEKRIKKGQETLLQIPTDFFKDIDDSDLNISLNANDLDWIQLDSEQKILKLYPLKTGEFKVEFIATDKVLNKTVADLNIIVVEQ